MVEISDKQVNEIKAKLDVMIRLLAASTISDDRSIKDNALVLSRAGLTPREIADMLGTTRNTVSVALSTARTRRASVPSCLPCPSVSICGSFLESARLGPAGQP